MKPLERIGFFSMRCVLSTGGLFFLATRFPALEHPLGILAAALAMIGLICALIVAIGYSFFHPLVLPRGKHER